MKTPVRSRLLSAALIGFLGSIGSAAGQTITFDQILANPDDLQLSYAYARQEVQSGRLEQAAGALERILLNEPNFDAARLFYAVVLYRLDDIDGARRELELLQGRPMSQQMADEVAKYLDLVNMASRATHFLATISMGVGIDSNPSLISRSDTGLSGGETVDLDGDEEVDGSFIAAGSLRVEHDLKTGRGDFLFAEASTRLREQFEVNSADLLTGRVEAGVSLFAGDLNFTPSALYRAYNIDDDLFLTEAGGRLEAEYAVSPSFTLLASVTAVEQDYHEDDDGDDFEFQDRDGSRVDVGGGFRARLADRNTLTAEATYINKEADSDSQSYDGYEIHVNDVHFLGMGQYLILDAWYWDIDYDAPNPNIDKDITREDERWRARLAYGLPLSTLFSGADLPSEIGGINMQISASYYNQDSNIRNFDADNLSGELLFTKSVGF